MFRNYLKIAWRNLLKNKAFSFLNISGLAIGMASALMIMLWVQNEVSYDQFHKNKDYIYEAWNRGVSDGKVQCWDNTPNILGATLKKDYPEVSDIVRTIAGSFVTAVGDRKFSSAYLIVDPGFLTMFSFPLIQGNPQSALNDIYSIVITEKMATRLFGKDDPMNKQIKIDSNNFTVTGIMKDLPTNTRFGFDYLLSWKMMKKLGWDDEFWDNNRPNTFVQLKPQVNFEALSARIKTISQIHSKGSVKEEIFLHPLNKWHLYSKFENGKEAGGIIDTVRMFMLIAGFILLIACINFMNLSTARSEKRAKEVGIRKVSGAYKSALVIQFLGESLLIAFISGILGLLLVQVFLPSYDIMIGKQLMLPYLNPYFWLYAFFFILITGLLAGSYPAFFLSSFKPVSVLKGKFKNSQALITPRRVLVILQFSFAIILIICTIVVAQQIRFAQKRNTGYDRSQLVYHFMTGTLTKNYAMVKNELLQSGIATEVNRTSWPLTEIWSDTWDIGWEGKSPYDKTDFDRFSTDGSLVKTAGLKLIEGRDMDLTKFPTDSTAALLNERALKAMGFKNPIGQLITDNGKTYHVIGVIKDFILKSPFDPVSPMAIEGSASNTGLWVMNVKLVAGSNAQDNMVKMEKILKKYNPDYPFEYHFVDEEYARKFEDTKRTATLSALFAGLTIVISCLGLFGLASFMAVQRRKEIGVRKVLGATVLNLWQLLSKDFIVLVLISLCIAVPISWYFMQKWLLQFEYRTALSLWIFASAGLGAILITLLTISYQSLKAALTNPVSSLRTE
ncbi:MAG TPA: ABC transporter permease [Puia sp.]|nr:ABC transporter permease [Puia sp.]